jgi:hypothetical protein
MNAGVVTFRCGKCKTGFKVMVSLEEATLLGTRPRCPVDGCKGRMSPGDPKEKDQIISGIDLYIAVSGQGLPEEKREAGIMKLLSSLKGKRIVSLKLKRAGDVRSIIESLTIEGGKTFHFASSTKGATIFKVTEGKTHVRKQ